MAILFWKINVDNNIPLILTDITFSFFSWLVLLQYPVYFAFEDSDIEAVLADIKRNDATGQPATATTGG